MELLAAKDSNFIVYSALEKEANRIDKKKQKYNRTTKHKKAFKEWKLDFIRDNDEDLMLLLTEQMTAQR